ncbi:unnamed protein product [Ranitomeya imitator]|uniref:N-acetylneuraminate lyase n=1 Tax=Ranitomeya imitator TaxID=111125 RepID=A0ABN9KPS5_9NEOB|nr:unnamed protein product [Ranitomeya imitator]
MTSSSCLHAPAQAYFVCPVEGRAQYCSAQEQGLSDLSRRMRTAVLCSALNRADKVHLRRSRSVKIRRERHLMKMGGAGPDHDTYRTRLGPPLGRERETSLFKVPGTLSYSEDVLMMKSKLIMKKLFNFKSKSASSRAEIMKIRFLSKIMASDGKRLKGLVAATFTPMNLNFEINLSIIQQYVDYLVQKQKVRIFLERKRLAEEWVKHARGKMDSVIVHVGCLSLEDSKDLAAHAASCGADAISAVSPSVIKPSCPDALVMFMKEVASAAPSLPFYYYHIPSLTDVTFQVNDLTGRMKVHIPSFRGVKFSGTNLLDFSMCIHGYKDCDFLYGQLLGALVFGAHGAVGSTYNYLGATTNKMLTAYGEGDLEKARKIQVRTQEFIAFVFALGWGLPEFKNIMSTVSGIDLGPPRLPLVSGFKLEHLEKIRAEMKRLDLI